MRIRIKARRKLTDTEIRKLLIAVHRGLAREILRLRDVAAELARE